jgi:hypothetical protein
MFFSEEKNQKTFTSRQLQRSRPRPGSFRERQQIKVFCFFSSEKKTFLPALQFLAALMLPV